MIHESLKYDGDASPALGMSESTGTFRNRSGTPPLIAVIRPPALGQPSDRCTVIRKKRAAFDFFTSAE